MSHERDFEPYPAAEDPSSTPDHKIDREPSAALQEFRDVLGRERVSGLREANSSVGVNPKDKIGAAKVDLTLCSPIAKLHWAMAAMDGATKYGPYNWRIEPVQLRTYVGAAMRHLECYLDGEEVASDSGIHHMGHVMACGAIVLDAEHYGSFVDDRPVTPQDFTTAELMNELNRRIKEEKPEGWGR